MQLFLLSLLCSQILQLLAQVPEIVVLHDGTSGLFELAFEWRQRLVMVFRNLEFQQPNFRLTSTTSLLYRRTLRLIDIFKVYQCLTIVKQLRTEDQRKLYGLISIARCGRGDTLQLVAERMYPQVPFLRVDTEYCHQSERLLLTWIKTDVFCFFYVFQNWVNQVNFAQELTKMPILPNSGMSLTHGSCRCPFRLRLATHIADAYQSKYRRNILNGRVIRLGVYNNSLSLVYGNLSEPKTLKFIGVLAEDMKAIAFTLNYTFDIVIPKDRKIGAKTSNGSWDGLFGLASKNEIDLMGYATNLYHDRHEIVDWISTNYDNTFAFIIPIPDVEQNWLASTQPYHYIVWICVIGILVCLGLLARFHDYVERFTQPRLAYKSCSQYVFNYLRVLLNQGSDDAINHNPNRIIMSVWSIFALVVINLYTSVLTGYLTVPQVKPLISSLEQLVQSSRVRMLFVNNTSLKPVFMDPQATGNVAIIAQRARRHPEDFVANSSEAIELIAKKGWLVYTDSVAYSYAALAQDYQKYGRCRVSMVPYRFFTVPVTYAIPKGSPYWHFFYIGGMRVVESGIHKQMNKKLLQRSPCVDMMNTMPISSKLQLTDFLSPYVLASIGVALSVTGFMFERCYKN